MELLADHALPLFLAAVGIGLVAYCRVLASRAERSQFWPPATGTVTRSEVVMSSHQRSSVYRALIEYTYRVGDQDYTGDTICAGGTLDTSMRRHAERRCAKYPLGASVPVFYDPSHPDRSCLEKTAEGVGLFTAIGVGLIAVAALSLLGILPLG